MFNDLIGKQIQVQKGERISPMFIAAIDYDSGITMKHLSDVPFGCDLCLNKKTWDSMALAGEYEDHFWSWILAIRAGIFCLDDYKQSFGYRPGLHGTGATVCSFS